VGPVGGRLVRKKGRKQGEKREGSGEGEGDHHGLPGASQLQERLLGAVRCPGGSGKDAKLTRAAPVEHGAPPTLAPGVAHLGRRRLLGLCRAQAGRCRGVGR
jgi:hypothetical protein